MFPGKRGWVHFVWLPLAGRIWKPALSSVAFNSLIFLGIYQRLKEGIVLFNQSLPLEGF